VSGSVRRPSFPRLKLESLRFPNPASSFGTCCASYGFLNLDIPASSPSLSPSRKSGEGPFDFETLADAAGGVLPSIRRVDAGDCEPTTNGADGDLDLGRVPPILPRGELSPLDESLGKVPERDPRGESHCREKDRDLSVGLWGGAG